MGKRMMRVLIFVFAFAIAGYAIVQYSVLEGSNAGLVAFKLQKPNFELHPWIDVLYIHIVTALFALVIGPFQLFMKPAKDRKRLHKLLGYVYVISIIVSGIVSTYLSFFATGGWIAGLGFMLLDIGWVATTLTAVRKIMVHDIQAHKAWMLRSYSLTFAAVTLRLWLAPLVLLMGDFEAAYRIVAWICWIPNLLVMEAVIRKKANRQLS